MTVCSSSVVIFLCEYYDSVIRRTRNKLMWAELEGHELVISHFLFVVWDPLHLQKNAACLTPWLVSVSTQAFLSFNQRFTELVPHV